MWHTIDVKETAEKIGTNLNFGLSEKEAKERIKKYGENKLSEGKKTSIFIKFIKQFQDFMIITLICAAIISAVMAYVEKTSEYIDSIIIIFIVVLNAILGLIQESKAEKALEALKSMSAPIAKLKRDGKIISIPASEIVPGDYIMIEAGNYVPADARLVKTYNLKVEESSLTGENVPILKDEKEILSEKISIGDMKNMVFATTIVVQGHAEAIVTETGMNTKVGKIATMILANESPETPLQAKLGEVRQKTRISCSWNLLFNIYNRNDKENSSRTDVYDSCWLSSCSNSRGIASNSNYNAIYWSNQNGKKECNN